MSRKKVRKIFGDENGISLPEITVILLIGGIILLLALPQIIASRRMLKFTSIQRQVATSLIEARQEAMSQRKPVTFRYDNTTKRILIYGGSFGSLGNADNRTADLAGFGVDSNEIVYGRPAGVSTAALPDTTNITSLTANIVEVTFQPDGSVINASYNPENKALFFYNPHYDRESAFAVSVLGAGGRVKVWRYKQSLNQYVE